MEPIDYTLARANFESYAQFLAQFEPDLDRIKSFDELSPDHQMAWKVAADAVLERRAGMPLWKWRGRLALMIWCVCCSWLTSCLLASC